MSDLISRQKAIEAIEHYYNDKKYIKRSRTILSAICLDMKSAIDSLPSAQPTTRERALMLLLNWAVECNFGYDNFPEEYERYKDEIEDMGYIDGMIYIAEREVERNG